GVPERGVVLGDDGRRSLHALTIVVSMAPGKVPHARPTSGAPMGRERLISADSHVAISVERIRERVPSGLRDAFDDAIAQQAAIADELRGGKQLSLDDWDMEAFRDPGYREPVARLAAMDRDGVDAEVLYSEVSAFRAFGLVKGDWKPISRAFTDLMADFASVD